MNIKKEFLNSLPNSNQVIRDTFELGDGKVIYIKESKIYVDNNNYWFTINTDNINNFQVYKVTDIILIGSAGYYDIPINVLNEFVDNFAVVPPDGKYHMHIYLENHLLSQNSLNQIDVSDYYKELPFEIVKTIDTDDRTDTNEIETNSLTINKNFFSTNTNVTSIDQVAPTNNEEFVFDGIYTLEDKIRIGDIIFFTQHGDKPKWAPGLSAICEVTQAPFDKGYDSTKIKNFRIKMKPLIVLPEVLNRSEFMGYFNCYDVTFIGPTTKGEPNQAISSMTLDKAKHVTGAIIDTFPELKENIEDFFGSGFSIITRKAVVPNDSNIKLNSNLFEDISKTVIHNNIPDEVPRNLIVYGAPGTGKSYKLKKDAEELFPNEWLRTRITFHPNYSYRNFVGSYKPMPLYRDSKKKIFSSDAITENRKHQKEPFIEYQFEPGPFLEMLVRAIQNQDFNFIIIIEEINRANTAGVFGDVFQLLDRNKSGESEYSITLEPSAHDYLKANGIITSSIIIPKNLYLWATMNSADQGVMPLDSAFKRRWSFEHIGLNENMNSVDDKYIEIPFIRKGNKKLKWNEFRKVINEKLLTEGIHEDKLIGPFFLNKFEISSAKSVKNKLLLYLKEDVLRYKSCLFHGDLRSFSEISERFTNGDNIFSDDMIFITEPLGNTDEDIEQRLDQTNSEGIEIEKTATQNIDVQ